MILADKIIEERKKNGWSQEELAEKLSVSRQSVSKWEGAQSVPDLQRIIAMAELFGVSTDYLLKDDMVPEVVQVTEQCEPDPALRQVSMEEAQEYMEYKRKSAPKIASGVALCILSPALLIFLAGLSGKEVLGIRENSAVGIGLTVLLVMVAAAVALFIIVGLKEKKYAFLETDCFETAYGVSGVVKEKQTVFSSTYSIGLVVGVVLCIVAAVPLVIVSVMGMAAHVISTAVAVLLVFIAVAVFMMVYVGIIRSSYDTLLEEGEYSRKEKLINKKLGPFNGAYWCIIVAIYLGWSFVTNKWDFTWVVWPVAALLFWAISSALRSFVGRNIEK